MRLAEGRILVEQLRLLQGNVGSTVISVVLLALLMLWVLSNDSNEPALMIWAAAVILSVLNCYRYARRHLAIGIPIDQARNMVWVLMMLRVVDGLLWGALPWITLDTSTLAGSVLVMSVIAGMAGGAISLLSPVLPVFVAFVLPELAAVASKMWSMGDQAYTAIGVACVLYIVALLDQARNNARAARKAIELRFENIELMEMLRVETGIAEDARREAELAHREAEQANAAKSKFLAAASHDLRQPIHAQGLFMGVLGRTELNPYQREVLASANAASKSSVEMLNTLLDFSRIEAGVVEPQIQAFRLQPLLNKIEREFGPQADAKGLAYRSRETGLAVRSDPMLVELILRNLVSNAIRYTEQGGLLVACRKRGDQAWLEVWDTGIGIAQAYQQEVFSEFHQLGNPERDSRKGLGLGLAIAEGLANTLGHKLSLVSTPQRGSVFRLSLPIITAILPVEELGSTQNMTRLHNLRVLVLDDDEFVRAAMLHVLRGWGCSCNAAGSITEALDLARISPPDLLICDYRLREHRSGLEAIAALRALLGNALPALLITGDTAPDRLREAQFSGIPVMHKPVAPGQLYRELVTLLPH